MAAFLPLLSLPRRSFLRPSAFFLQRICRKCDEEEEVEEARFAPNKAEIVLSRPSAEIPPLTLIPAFSSSSPSLPSSLVPSSVSSIPLSVLRQFFKPHSTSVPLAAGAAGRTHGGAAESLEGGGGRQGAAKKDCPVAAAAAAATALS